MVINRKIEIMKTIFSEYNRLKSSIISRANKMAQQIKEPAVTQIQSLRPLGLKERIFKSCPMTMHNYAYMHAHVRAHTQTHMHTCTCTHTHTYTHIHKINMH